jgi:hypothetical protein
MATSEHAYLDDAIAAQLDTLATLRVFDAPPHVLDAAPE